MVPLARSDVNLHLARAAFSGMMGGGARGACPLPMDVMNPRARLSTHSSLLTLVAAGCLCALPACGDDDVTPPVPDAGPDDLGAPDLGPPDLGPVYPSGGTCADPHLLVGTPTGDVSVAFNTTGEPSGQRDIGLSCGSQEAPRWAPQHIVQYTVPGSGLQRVDFSTISSGTGRRVDTIVQVRTTCDEIPGVFPPGCFDNTSATELRASGSMNAMGGETLFFVVTTFEATAATGWSDRGPIELTVSSRSATPPTITEGTAYRIGTRVEFNATGMDPDGDAAGVHAAFLDAAGNPVDLSNNGTTDEGDVPSLQFATSVAGMTTFSGTSVFEGLTAYIEGAPTRATQVELSVFDQGYALSAAVRVPLTTLTEVGTGEVCDTLSRCRAPLTCDAGACAVPPAFAALCGAATPIMVAEPTTTTTTGTASGTAGAGTSSFAPSRCLNPDGSILPATGGEKLFTFTVTAANFDLTATTDVPGTGAMEDTILYVRSSCADPGSEFACNDDINYSAGNARSRIERQDLTPGTYTIFVEPFATASSGPGSTTFSLSVSLRPVLATGAACDPAQVQNRCGAGACPSGATPTCP